MEGERREGIERGERERIEKEGEMGEMEREGERERRGDREMRDEMRD